jgi:LacI family transcriptional regulator
MKSSRSVSIVDVAKKAGLSPTTVSRVINKNGYFSEETMRKVDSAIEELGYRPNWMARSLKGKPSKLIGLIIPDISNVFYTTVAHDVSSSLRKLGYDMILCVSDENPEKDLNYLQILDEKRVDGIIYTHPAFGCNPEYIRKLVDDGLPIVEINRQSEKNLLDAVLADNFRGVQQVVAYLTNLGHVHIGCISGGPFTITGAERLSGFQTAMAQTLGGSNPVYIKSGTFSKEFGEQATAELLDLPVPPTAIFAGSNRIALGVLSCLRERKFRIPDDVSLVVFDDADWMAAWNPPITAVDIAVSEMANLAVETLHRRMHNEMPGTKPITYHLSTSLIIRDSCSPIQLA